MEFFTELFSTTFMSAIGWTVIHSLWMGAVVLALVYISQHSFAKYNSARRYGLAFTGHVLLLLFSAATFCYYYAASGTGLSGELLLTGPAGEAIHRTSAFSGEIKNIISSNAPTIALLWLMGMMLLTIRMAIGYRFVIQLRKKTTQLNHPQIARIVDKIKNRFNINTSIDLRTTASFMTPLLTGLFRPFIVLPLAIINSLEMEEVELILAHELAHLKRYDHIAVIVQQMIETLLYFNPATWILSRQLNKYREEACDDMVVEAMGRDINYAKSLVKLQELQTQHIQGIYALSALGQKNQLLNRIKRIMNMENNNRSNLGRVAMLLLIPMAFVLVSFYAKHEAKKNQEVNKLAQLVAHVEYDGATIEVDTVPLPRGNSRIIEKISKKENGREIEAEFENKKLQYLKIDGERMTPEEATKYQDIVEELESELNENHIKSGDNRDMRFFKFNKEDGEDNEDIRLELDFDFDDLGENMGSLFENLGSDMGNLFEEFGEDIGKIAEEFELDEEDGGVTIRRKGNTIFEFHSDDENDDLLLRLNGKEFEIEEFQEKMNHHQERLMERMKHLEHLQIEDDGENRIIIRGLGDEDFILDQKEIEKWAEKFEIKAEKWAEKFERNADQWSADLEEQLQSRGQWLEERGRALEQHGRELEEQGRAIERNGADLERNKPSYNRGSYGKSNTMQSRIEKELKRDGFMSDRSSYTFKLKENRLKINGKKQSDDMYEKYKAIYERYTGSKLNNSTYSIGDTEI